MEAQVISSQAVLAGQAGRIMPKGLFWRGNSLWARVNLPGHPDRFPLGIKTTGSASDRKRAEREGEAALASIRTKYVEGRFFDKKEDEVPTEYNPKFWRLAARYWYYHLRHKKSAKHGDRYHFKHCLRKFGNRYAKEIFKTDVEAWMNEMKSTASVNAVNLRFSYLKAVFRFANAEDNPRRKFSHDPTFGLKKLPGAKVRQFVLTEELFERNLAFFKEESPRFALYYLALWETGRRPLEVKQYTWEMVQEIELDGQRVRVLMIPNTINKTDNASVLPISDRLWTEINQTMPHEGPIFRNELGQAWDDYRHHFYFYFGIPT